MCATNYECVSKTEIKLLFFLFFMHSYTHEDALKDTCAAWGGLLEPADIWGGCGRWKKKRKATHLLTFNHVLLDACFSRHCRRREATPPSLPLVRPGELLHRVNHSSQHGDTVRYAALTKRPASFNPDKLIGSRRGEGGPCGPPIAPLSKERREGRATRLKETKTITAPVLNHNYLAMTCTGQR